MLASMTGFGRSEGSEPDLSWVWEVRSVNGRGLELRWRLPSGFEGLEPALRQDAAARMKRGTVQASLAVRQAVAAGPVINEAALERMLQIVLRLAERVPGAPAPRVELLLGLPGVMGAGPSGEVDAPPGQAAAVRAGFGVALDRMVMARRGEGERLGEILRGLVGQIEGLRGEAAAAAAEQPVLHRERLRASVAALLESVPALPEERLAQEVALLASRSDVREELDRLGSHVAAVSALLAVGGAVGRQLDFLVQELVRETNTICSKSSTRALTAVGLQLKGVVEQVREQVQNLE